MIEKQSLLEKTEGLYLPTFSYKEKTSISSSVILWISRCTVSIQLR